MITIVAKGSFDRTASWMRKMASGEIYNVLSKYGEVGRAALAQATPTDSGQTAASWSSDVSKKGNVWQITWSNSNENAGVNVAIILQYGHGTGTGGYVAGQDYINPAIKPVFDQIAEAVWREVTRG
jgi:hypothetical protein